MECEEDFQLKGAQLAVGDDEEVAAAARGVEEAEGGNLFLEGEEAFASANLEGLGAGELGAEVVEEEGADDLEDVALGGVVRADLPAFLRLHHRLKEGAEDSGGDARPVEGATREELRAHGRGESGEGEALAVEVAIDVGELEQVGVEVLLAAVFGRVEHVEELAELGAEVGAVGGGVVLDVELKGARGEDAVVLAEEAEEEADEELFQLVPGVAGGVGAVFAGFQRVVQIAHELGGFFVGGVFRVELVLPVARHEEEVADVFVEVGQWKLEAGREALEKGRVGILLRLQVVDGDALEVGDDEVTGDFLAAPGVHEATDVFHALRVGLAEVFTGALVLGEQGAGPEEVNVGPVAGELFHRLLEAGDDAALLAEDEEEGVPEGFGLGVLARLVLPVLREDNGAVFDFVPRERHGGKS